MKSNSFNYEQLIKCAKGLLFGKGNAQLPMPPMLMLDRIININNLSGIMYEKIMSDPRITVSLKSDENTTMKLITDIHSELRKANALKLSYSALTETD